MMKIGIIRERKNPPDTRVALTPLHCRKILETYNFIDLVVEPSKNRCFSDIEYQQEGIPLSHKLSSCDVLIGVKEVPIEALLERKIYFFFSHTIKKQAYNRGLLSALVSKNIRMIDYEALTNQNGKRVIAFGKFAGMVGAHNAIFTYSERHRLGILPRMNKFRDYREARNYYKETNFPNNRIVLTGTGRVANGSALVLNDMGYIKVTPKDFLLYPNQGKVYTQLRCQDYAQRIVDHGFDKKEFFEDPSGYESKILPYLSKADIFINGIYWDSRAPVFFTLEQMIQNDFKIEVIADITCDIAPLSSVPSTIRPSTIADPVYGFDPKTNQEISPYQETGIDVMAIDNLPNELPRDASEAFGEQFLEFVMPELDDLQNSVMIANATVTDHGDLGLNYEYLRDFLNGQE
jgi:alanine dehydrogenase